MVSVHILISDGEYSETVAEEGKKFLFVYVLLVLYIVVVVIKLKEKKIHPTAVYFLFLF